MNVKHIGDLILGPPGNWRIVRLIVYTFIITATGRLIPIPGRRKRAPIGRRKRRHRIPLATSMTVVFAGLALAATAVTGSVVYTLRHASPMITAGGYRAPVAVDTGAPYVGVFEPEPAASYAMVTTFAKTTGLWPGIVLSYTATGAPFALPFARNAASHHAVPFIQMLPQNISLANIAAGRDDSYLTSYAQAVRAFGQHVIIGFAPEMNGSWYRWGASHTNPADYVAAWRHVVDLFHSAKATNVIWLWTVANTSSVPNLKLSQWWPGSDYVTWIGIDGYYYRPKDTFTSVFGDALTQTRALGRQPVLISETAVGPHSNGPGQIINMFTAVKKEHLLGLVWFDQAQHSGQYHQNWRLEGRSHALQAFRGGVNIIRQNAKP